MTLHDCFNHRKDLTGGDGGSRVPLTFFLKKNIWNNSLTVKTCFANSWALYYIHIVVEVTINMAEYTSSWQSAAGAAEECQF